MPCPSIFKLLMNFGVTSKKRTARTRDARLLKMPANNPILLLESINVDQTGTVIEYGVTRFRGDRMELMMDHDV